MFVIVDGLHPFSKLLLCHEIQDPAAINPGPPGSSQSKLNKSELRRAVGIGTDRYSASRFFGQSDEVEAQILTIGVGIDFDGLVEFGCHRKDSRPIRV